MPELAEVEYYRKQWLPGIGKRIVSVQLHGEKRIFRGAGVAALERDLVGKKMTRAQAHGKQMLFVFGERCWLGVHLGMTGKTRFESAGFAPGKHDHLVLFLESGGALVFSDSRMFGRILYAAGEGPPEWWSSLPPEILSDEFTCERLTAYLKRRAKAPIKSVLLMQEAFPGVGNWMADEILFKSRISPKRPAGGLSADEQEKLCAMLRYVSREALRVIGTDWGDLPDSWLFNYRWKDGGVCPKTGWALVREKIGGRTTCWSPEWQR
jgi:formamidopyrimidine-DNA glycosylase